MYNFNFESISIRSTTWKRNNFIIEILMTDPIYFTRLTAMAMLRHEWNWGHWMIKFVFTKWKKWSVCKFYIWISWVKLRTRLIIWNSRIVEILDFFHYISKETIFRFSSQCKWLIRVNKFIDLIYCNIVNKNGFYLLKFVYFWPFLLKLCFVIFYEI